MNELYFFAIFSRFFIIPLLSILPFVFVDAGYGSTGVSLVASISTLSYMVSGLIWSKIKSSKSTIYKITLLAIISCLLIYIFLNNMWIALLFVFLFTILQDGTYYLLLFELSRKNRDFTKIVRDLEFFCEVGSIIGFVFLIIVSKLVIQNFINLFLFFSTFFLFSFFLYIVTIYFQKIIRNIPNFYSRDINLLVKIETGLNIFEKYSEEVFFLMRKRIEHTIAHPLFYHTQPVIKVPSFSLITRNLCIAIPNLVYFFGIALIFPQISFLERKYFKLSSDLIILLNLIATTIYAISVRKLPKLTFEDTKKYHFLRVLSSVVLGLLFLFAPKLIELISLELYKFVMAVLWAFVIIAWNSYLLSKSRELLGLANFFRNLGYLLGSLASSVILQLDYAFNAILGGLLMLVGTFFLFKFK